MGANAVLLPLLSICLTISTGNSTTITISTHGKDVPLCKNVAVAVRPPCKTFDFVFDGGKGISDNTIVIIEPGYYSLENDTLFENKHNISLIGNKLNGTNHKISCSRPNIGISFFRCETITIEGLDFENCGKLRSVSTQNLESITSAINFIFSKDLTITHSRISKSNGIGVALIDSGGTVDFRNVDIIENDFGSGVLIATTKCGALDPVNCTSQREQQKYIHNNVFNFTFVFLIGNRHYQKDVPFLEETSLSTPKIGTSGGMTIHLFGNATGNRFSISFCSFYNNTAQWGGGLYIAITNTSQNNVISGLKNAFLNNNAVYGGGAVQMTLLNPKRIRSSQENKIQFMNSYFGFNRAIWGGAVSIRASTKIFQDEFEEESSSPITLKSVVFSDNQATVGSAIALSTDNVNYGPIGPGVSYSLLLQGCNITRNEIIETEDKKVVGQGSIYAEEFMLSVDSTTFLNNSGTAVVLDSSLLKISGNVVFIRNKGEKGGAIALYGTSWIELTAKCILSFVNNSAVIKGGAIYFKHSGAQRVGFQTTRLSIKDCFFRYEHQVFFDPSKWDSKVIFIDNMAPDAAGNSIFASSLEMCRQHNEPRMNNSALEWQNVFIYLSTFKRSYPEIATEAIGIVSQPHAWKVLPGVPFTPEVSLINEKGNSVYGTVKVILNSTDDPSIHLDPPNNVFLIKDRINDMKIIGEVNSGFFVNLMTTDGQLTRTQPEKVLMRHCPPGYKQIGGNTCTCMEKEKAITRCGENFTAYLLAGYWGHFSNATQKFEAYKCPKHYCRCDIKDSYYECPFDAIKCAPNRTGNLCSHCLPGYSVKLGDENCGKCTNVYSLLLIPILLAASGFVLVVFYFNFDAFSGYLNAFLYSYQTIDTIIPEVVQVDPFVGFIIGTLCLSGTGNSFGICLFNGFTDLQKLGFNLAVPFYILLFTVFIGKCLSGALFRRLFRSSSCSYSLGRAFSFVYTYCYTALTSKALILLNPIKIDNKWMLYSSANIPYFGKEHIVYAIAAIFVLLVFTLGFPIVLLFTPFFTKKFRSLQKMEPAFNALKLCFKNPINSKTGVDYGSFAAFYFVCRLTVLLCSVFVKDETPRLVLIAIANVLFQSFFSWFQPYVVWTMNFWDAILLTNMCVISIVSVIVSVPYMLEQVSINILTIVLKILVYAPLMVIVIRFIAYKKNVIERKRLRSPLSFEGNFIFSLYFFTPLANPRIKGAAGILPK